MIGRQRQQDGSEHEYGCCQREGAAPFALREWTVQPGS
jgi:hypothetical protein